MVDEILSVENLDNCLDVLKKDQDGNIIACRIKEGVKVIEECTFSDWTKLEKIILPESLEEIGEDVFDNCTSLKSIDLHGNLKIIRSSAFNNCSSLKNICCPESLEEIEYGAFAECTALEKINLPINIKKIGNGIFHCCAKLEIVIPEGWENSKGICEWFDDAVDEVFDDECNVEFVRNFVIKEAAKDSPQFIKKVSSDMSSLFNGYYCNYELMLEIAKAGGETVLYAMHSYGHFDENNNLCGNLINLANKDNPAAQCILAVMIRNGMSYSLETIESWYNGNPYAVFDTNWFWEALANEYLPKYKKGEFYVVDEYIDYVRKRARKGYVNAQKLLAKCYENGYGVRKNARYAKIWSEKAKPRD